MRYEITLSLLISQSNAEVSLNKEKDRVKPASGSGSGLWNGGPTTVHLDGTAKGKIKEKTDVGMFCLP